MVLWAWTGRFIPKFWFSLVQLEPVLPAQSAKLTAGQQLPVILNGEAIHIIIRPLLMVRSRSRPEGAQNGRRRHPRLALGDRLLSQVVGNRCLEVSTGKCPCLAA